MAMGPRDTPPMLAARRRYTFAEYVRLEEYSNVKHEYWDGEVYAMAGGTREHAALAARIIARIGAETIGRECEVFTSDLRVRVAATGLACYPDVTVVCGPPETDPADRNTVLSPTVIFEVTSDSTEDYDRTEKLDNYRQIPSLREIVLVSHRSPSIEVWRRGGHQWLRHTFGPGEDARFESITCGVSVDDLYRGVVSGGGA